VQIDEIARLAEALAGVRRTTPDGLAQWRYHDAKLRGAQLWWADLRRARLLGTDLTGADLTIADLRDADLSGAKLSAVMPPVCLRRVHDRNGAGVSHSPSDRCPGQCHLENGGSCQDLLGKLHGFLPLFGGSEDI